MTKQRRAVLFASAVLTVGAMAPAVLAQPGVEFSWAHITAPGNRGWDRGEAAPGTVNGRGVVDHTFYMSRFEVTTGQWMEFINTYSARADQPDWLRLPRTWGAEVDPGYNGPGTRYRLANRYQTPEMHSVAGITWREVARFCNWLHNDKSSTLSASESGAYDTSTFGYNPDGTFTDQLSRSPGARYWIPSYDEWLKAAHYDPQRDYWYMYPTGSDTPPVGGIPGVGETNAQFVLPGFAEVHIPLGSYPHVQSPFGLLDASGTTAEFTESLYIVPDVTPVWVRITRGSFFGTSVEVDRGTLFGGAFPDELAFYHGARIASSVPAPASGVLLIAAIVVGRRRRSGGSCGGAD